MEPSVILYPAELHPIFPRRLSRKERTAVAFLKKSYDAALEEANRIYLSLKVARHNYNYLSDLHEIDACIYQICTQQSRYASALNHLQELQTRMENLLKES